MISFITVTAAVGDKFAFIIKMAFFDAKGVADSDAVRPPGGNFGGLYLIVRRFGINMQAAVVAGDIEFIPACLHYQTRAAIIIGRIPGYISRAPIAKFDNTGIALEIKSLDFFLFRLNYCLYFTGALVF